MSPSAFRPAVAALLAALALAAGPARGAGADAAGPLEEFGAGLTAERDAIDPGATGADAARRAALDRALRALAKPSGDLATDLARALAAARALRRPFGTTGAVPDLVSTATFALRTAVSDRLGDLFLLAIEATDSAVRERALAFEAKGTALLDRADAASTDLARLRVLRKAAKRAEAGHRVLEDAGVEPPPPPVVPVTATVDGIAFRASSGIATWTAAAGSLTLRALDTSTAMLRDLRFTLTAGVTGTGTHALTGGEAVYREGVPAKTFTSTAGTLVITEFDSGARVLRGTFSFTASGSGGTRTVSAGVIDIASMTVR